MLFGTSVNDYSQILHVAKEILSEIATDTIVKICVLTRCCLKLLWTLQSKFVSWQGNVV